MSRQARIQHLLQPLMPSHLEVINESSMHQVPKDSETHFKILMVSEQFQGLSRIARHRLVNKQLQAELNHGLHALSMHLFTVVEWEQRTAPIENSPKCRNGRRHDH